MTRWDLEHMIPATRSEKVPKHSHSLLHHRRSPHNHHQVQAAILQSVQKTRQRIVLRSAALLIRQVARLANSMAKLTNLIMATQKGSTPTRKSCQSTQSLRVVSQRIQEQTIRDQASTPLILLSQSSAQEELSSDVSINER